MDRRTQIRTNTTTNIKNTVVGLDVHLESKVVLMARDSLEELFTRVVTSKMERTTPTILMNADGR
jgi:hypothetical protein